MNRNRLPVAPEMRAGSGISCDLSPRALERWNPAIQAKDEGETISVFDVIGADPWTGDGVTAKRIAGALRSIGEKDVTVHVNSPGGDMFEGLAIYNLLREHKGKVTVKVVGLAASAASIIAMAGDEVQIARAGFLMIHNSWVFAAGNKHALREIADTLDPFDRAMADIYAARSGESMKAIEKMMDAETWIGGADAVDAGFADSLLPSDQVVETEETRNEFAARKVDLAMAKAGMPRSERRRLIQELKSGTQNAVGAGDDPGQVTQDADLTAVLSLSNDLRGILS
jgi:ATP-dependent Clp protease protease subunit